MSVSAADVRGLMRPVHEPGEIADRVAPPVSGITGQPFDYEHVHVARPDPHCCGEPPCPT